MSSLAVSLDDLRVQFERRQKNKSSRDAAKAALRNFKQQEADDLTPLYTDPEEPGAFAGTAVVILDPIREGVRVERATEAPPVKDPRPLIGYRKTVLTLVPSESGATLTDDPEAKGEKFEAWVPVMSEVECSQAALRSLVAERRQYGPVDAWAVDGTIRGKRTTMLVVGRLSDLRYYWPDSMTRRRMKRAGVLIQNLGNPLHIRRHGV